MRPRGCVNKLAWRTQAFGMVLGKRGFRGFRQPDFSWLEWSEHDGRCLFWAYGSAWDGAVTCIVRVFGRIGVLRRIGEEGEAEGVGGC